MKLLRFGPRGQERPGIIDQDGRIRDLTPIVHDITSATIAGGAIQRIAKAQVDALPLAPSGVRIGACVGHVRNFIGVGMNYLDHALEVGMEVPTQPLIFNKAPNCIVGPADDVVVPPGSQKTDWEVELAIVIGRTCMRVSETDAPSHVAGYTICHDVSEREYQMELGGQFVKGKSCPTFGPLGPWLVTPDEIGDVQNLDLSLEVDGKRMQSSNTRNMIFSVARIISDISRYMTLDPGDVITTGTPAGVGMGMSPSRFLQGGETVSLAISGLGEQRQRVIRS
ncbi:MAG: fumarylacetoacetate hydrolase family protein [Rhizobiaceae bacterium]|nr:fumarylacetoacetate hydrolase family protein [Rhizobiaceae bacterium]